MWAARAREGVAEVTWRLDGRLLGDRVEVAVLAFVAANRKKNKSYDYVVVEK